MANRCTLHKSKLEEFKTFLNSRATAYRDGKGDYQVLQVQTKEGWQSIYERNDMLEHYTVQDKLMPTVRRFLKEKEAMNDMSGYFDSIAFVARFKDVQTYVHQTAKEKGWWDEDRNDGELIALMYSELSEGLEALRKDLPSDHITKFKGIEEELADCIIRIMDMAEARGYNLPHAIVEKLKFNEKRSYRHGGKKF